MILIADSGSTNTQWHLLNSCHKDFFTQGINPYYQSEKDIFNILKNEIPLIEEEIEHIYFFGAGCNQESKKNKIKQVLLKFWPNSEIDVESDLLGTCFATSAHKMAVCCILGTGSNSCLFNGLEIVDHVSPLGYILGDEGSGAHLGKTFINGLLKRQFTKDIEEAFYNQHHLDANDLLEKVYQHKWPNRFLASFAPFINSQLHHKRIRSMVTDCFEEFICKNIMNYTKDQQVTIHFTGSIAYYFKEQLISSLEKYDLEVGTIYKQPMEGLIKYFKQKNL